MHRQLVTLGIILALVGLAQAKALGQAENPQPAGDSTAQKTTNLEGPQEPSAMDAADIENEEVEAESTAPGFSHVLDELLHSGAIGLLVEGGWFMVPILLMGIVATGVIIERYRSLNMLRTDSTALRSKVRELLEQDRVSEALELCDSESGPVAAILSAGLRKFLVLERLDYDPGRIEEQVIKAMDDFGVHVVAALERHLPVLATISSAAPMLGFLGTVAGMITSFQDIVALIGETNIVEAAADGISVALLTTCFGLIVGIPAFIGFNYFSGVINRFVLDVEESATELIEAVTLEMAIKSRESAKGTDEPTGIGVEQNA